MWTDLDTLLAEDSKHRRLPNAKFRGNGRRAYAPQVQADYLLAEVLRHAGTALRRILGQFTRFPILANRGVGPKIREHYKLDKGFEDTVLEALDRFQVESADRHP